MPCMSDPSSTPSPEVTTSGTKTLTMTVIEEDGTRNASDITEYAMLLFVTGSSLSEEPAAPTVPFIELQLDGEWEWGSGITDDVALRRIGNAIIDAVLEAVAQ